MQSLMANHNLLRLIQFIQNKNNIAKAISSASQEISNYLKRSYPYMNPIGAETVSTYLIEDVLKDFTNYLIIKRISHKDNTTESDINSWLGERGVVKLNELIEQEIILIKDGNLKLAFKNFSLPPELIAVHAAEIIKMFFKIDNASNNQAMIRNFSESVNQETYNKAISILANAILEINTLAIDGPGNIPMTLVCMIDTLNFK